jgi:hypothetical protein
MTLIGFLPSADIQTTADAASLFGVFHRVSPVLDMHKRKCAVCSRILLQRQFMIKTQKIGIYTDYKI